jgi:predicted transposase YdaD
MSSSEIPQPHDSLIRYTFSSTENAISLFQAYLPPAIVAALQWEKLRQESGSYVHEDLRRSESDLLFSVPVEGEEESELMLYMLFEHQSTADHWLRLRLLGYMVEIWQRWRKQNPTARGLPPILPLVLSQVEGGWPCSVQFADLLQCPEALRKELATWHPRFEHQLIDLGKLSREDLAGNAAVRLMQGLLKAVMEGSLPEWIDWGAPYLRTIDSLEFLRALFLYAANAESDLNLREFAARIKSANIPKAAETIMSIAERIRIESEQRGEARGEARGEQRGRQLGEQKGLARGREEGAARGALIGQIQALQRILKRAESTPEALDSLDEKQLRSMIAELEGAFH